MCNSFPFPLLNSALKKSACPSSTRKKMRKNACSSDFQLRSIAPTAKIAPLELESEANRSPGYYSSFDLIGKRKVKFRLIYLNIIFTLNIFLRRFLIDAKKWKSPTKHLRHIMIIWKFFFLCLRYPFKICQIHLGHWTWAALKVFSDQWVWVNCKNMKIKIRKV